MSSSVDICVIDVMMVMLEFGLFDDEYSILHMNGRTDPSMDAAQLCVRLMKLSIRGRP